MNQISIEHTLAMVMPLWLVSKNEIASGNNCNTWSVLERMHFHDKTEFRVKKN